MNYTHSVLGLASWVKEGLLMANIGLVSGMWLNVSLQKNNGFKFNDMSGQFFLAKQGSKDIYLLRALAIKRLEYLSLFF